MCQLDKIFVNMKDMDSRLTSNEEDVMKLCKFLREDISTKQREMEINYNSNPVNEKIEVEELRKSQEIKGKQLLVTHEFEEKVMKYLNREEND